MNTAKTLGPSRRGRPNRITKPSNPSQRASRPNVSADHLLELQDGRGINNTITFASASDPTADELVRYGDETGGMTANLGGGADDNDNIGVDGHHLASTADMSMADAAVHDHLSANIHPELSKNGPSATRHDHDGADDDMDHSIAADIFAAAAAAAAGVVPAHHDTSQYPAPPVPPQHHPHSHPQQNYASAAQQQHLRASGSPGESSRNSTAKTTQQLAYESGYRDFKVDSAFAKRMAREPGQRLAEQRKPDQELNLVRRSNVEALFAQIAGQQMGGPTGVGGVVGGGGIGSNAGATGTACSHCRKTQGPWTVCVVYTGQMMGSCANCWFNASGARCSFHEKAAVTPYPPQNPFVLSLPDLQNLPTTNADTSINPYPDPMTTATPLRPNDISNAVRQPSLSLRNPASLWHVPASLQTHDAGVRQTIQHAFRQVRQADRYQRALMEVDVAAKQLALKVVAAEEVAAASGVPASADAEVLGHDDQEQQDQQENMAVNLQHGAMDTHDHIDHEEEDEDEQALHHQHGYPSPRQPLDGLQQMKTMPDGN